MTAVLGILNRSGCALAADSAVTFNDSTNSTKKILNTANKMFMLSKYHPVAVMIYNSADICGVPVEILVKDYRQKLGKNCFKKVSDYSEDFIKYLSNNKQYFNDSIQSGVPKKTIWNLYTSLHEQIQKKFSYNTALNEEVKNSILTHAINLLKGAKKNTKSILASQENFEFDLSFDDFVNQHKEDMLSLIQEHSNFPINIYENESIISILIELTYLRIQYYDPEDSQFTGIVFTGYGDEQIFPSCISTKVFYFFNNRIKTLDDKMLSTEITVMKPSFIAPFAQTDVIHTVLSGTNPLLDRVYQNTFEIFTRELVDLIAENFPENRKEIKKFITKNEYSLLLDRYRKEIDTYRIEEYINKLHGSISHLSKEDLAEMAESLVHLTYLQRRITDNEESVGGPVDVAVITKGDGFIWLKRKHYFNKDLNYHFLNNYFK